METKRVSPTKRQYKFVQFVLGLTGFTYAAFGVALILFPA
jgi:hypothetical protein